MIDKSGEDVFTLLARKPKTCGAISERKKIQAEIIHRQEMKPVSAEWIYFLNEIFLCFPLAFDVWRGWVCHAEISSIKLALTPGRKK